MENTCLSCCGRLFLSVLDSLPRHRLTHTGAIADLKERLNIEEEIPGNNPSVNLLLQSITALCIWALWRAPHTEDDRHEYQEVPHDDRLPPVAENTILSCPLSR